MLHQVQEERQVGGVEPLEQGQHVAAVDRVEEIVGVLDALADALEAQHFAERVLPQERVQLGVADLGTAIESGGVDATRPPDSSRPGT